MLTTGSGRIRVADGQQRLATIFILIAAIRDFLLELGDIDGANSYQSKYLLDYDPRKKTSQPKLTLNYEDKDYFIETILIPPKDRQPFTGRDISVHTIS